MPENFSIKKMPKPQRYSFYFLILLTIGIISLWIWQFNYRLRSNVSYSPQTVADSSADLNRDVLENFQNFEDLDRLEDTSISSARPSQSQEAIIYDPDEVPHAWTDPNLAHFKEFEEQLKLFEDQFVFDENLMAENEDEFFLNILGGQGDPEALRQLLILSGMEEEIISQLSDEELMEIYQEILSE